MSHGFFEDEPWTLGISPDQYQEIVASSLRAQEEMEWVKIKRDIHTGEAVLFNGLGDPLITLGEENAKSLYQQIAKAYGRGVLPGVRLSDEVRRLPGVRRRGERRRGCGLKHGTGQAS
jgi:hypothetical protein